MAQIKKLNIEDIEDIDWIDDSMMPSAEEVAKFPPLPEEIKESLNKFEDEMVEKLKAL